MNERIKELRKVLDITQQEFADKIGIKRNSFANYETGRNTPIDAIVLSICREYKVNETWLRTGVGEMFIEIDMDDHLFSWAGEVLADEPESFRRRFVNMLSEFSESDWSLLETKLKQVFDKC